MADEFSAGPWLDTRLQVIDEDNDTFKMLARITGLEPTKPSAGADE